MDNPEIHIAAKSGSRRPGCGNGSPCPGPRAVAARRRASVALAGGRTPGLLYRDLVAAGPSAAPWYEVDFFFGDERCVPPTSPLSNYALARRELLEPLGVPAAAVHRLEGETRPAAGRGES